MSKQAIFVTGATGYIGVRLLNELNSHSFRLIALVRPGSENKIPASIEKIVANVFQPEEWMAKVPHQCIFIHLLGVSHPSLAWKKLFESIDLRAVQMVADVARNLQAKKFIYLSVAMEPGPIMKDFQEAKRKGEEYIKALHLPYVFIRPWYVLGPGRWWPYLLFPLFKLLQIIPATAKKAKALGFVSIQQMILSLKFIVSHPDDAPEIVEIDEIKRMVPEGIDSKKHAWHKNLNRLAI